MLSKDTVDEGTSKGSTVTETESPQVKVVSSQVGNGKRTLTIEIIFDETEKLKLDIQGETSKVSNSNDDFIYDSSVFLNLSLSSVSSISSIQVKNNIVFQVLKMF